METSTAEIRLALSLAYPPAILDCGIFPKNNQITGTTGNVTRTYSHDNAGNASYTGETFTFNDRGRMSEAVSSGGNTNYIYNALGQLIEKSGNGGTTVLVYDEAGHVLGEYSSTGALIQETIWMGNLPVATLRPNGSTGCTSTLCIFYVHTDHLGSPRKVTTSTSTNSLMWRWDPDTFGSSTSSPNQNPAGLGTFVYNLRFPGQYALPESGLNYNYFRTYDPATGRYIESDPIGLDGGSNSTYTYVRNNPIGLSDPMGLWIPPIHKQMATASANQAGCSNIASQVGVATARVDALPTSQDPSKSFWHAMSDGTAKQSANETMQSYDVYVAQYSSSCKIDDLARALHAVEDSFSPAHEGFQSWMGFSNTNYFSLAIHGLKDAFPTPSAYGAAVQAGADIMSQAASRCPCLCSK